MKGHDEKLAGNFKDTVGGMKGRNCKTGNLQDVLTGKEVSMVYWEEGNFKTNLLVVVHSMGNYEETIRNKTSTNAHSLKVLCKW